MILVTRNLNGRSMLDLDWQSMTSYWRSVVTLAVDGTVVEL